MPAVLDTPARVRQVADAIALEANATIAVKNESDGSSIAATLLNGAIDDAVVTLTVDSSTGFPDEPFVVTIGSEDLNVTNVTGVTWTVTRGHNSTTPASHLDDAPVTYKRFTAARTYVADYTNNELKTLRVDVRSMAWGLEAESHGGSVDAYQVEITVQQWALNLATDRNAIDLLTDLTGRFGRYFCPKRILGVYGNVAANTVQVIEAVVQLPNPDKIKQGRFFGLVTVTLQEFVDR